MQRLYPAVSLETRGSTFPRLLLSVAYRDGNHIRMRAYVPTGEDAPELASLRVTDTLGANGIAEALLLAGLTIRYGETMHARPMRHASKERPRRLGERRRSRDSRSR